MMKIFFKEFNTVVFLPHFNNQIKRRKFVEKRKQNFKIKENSSSFKILCFRVITGISILLFGCLSFGQIKEYLDVNLSTDKINQKDFNGQLKLSVENISNDTVYISLEPFIFEVVNKTGIFNYVNLMSSIYSPNRITFVRSDMQTSQLDGFIRISYLKFPRILFLIPGRNYDLLLNIDERTSTELRDSSWVVFEDIWYGIKSCVDKAIKDKPPIIMEEFQYALISESEINIDLTTILYTNPSLYFRNDVDSCNIKEKCYTVYDSIIQKCFIKKY